MSEIDWDTPEIAGRYDTNSDHQYQKGLALIGMMRIKKGDAVLDVGCGTGRQALNVSAIIGPSGRLTGIDPSSHRLRIAKEKLQGNGIANASLLVGQCEDLGSFADASFDHAYFCSSFHWIDDKKKALGEILRVLKPGGSAGMTTPDRSSPYGMRYIFDPILDKYGYKGRRDDGFGSTRRVTALELYDLLSDAGFSDIYIEPRPIIRHYDSPEAIVDGKFGRAGKSPLGDIPEDIRQKIRGEIIEELDKMRTPSGIDFETYTLFATAKKPYED